MAGATNLHRKPLAAVRGRDAARIEIGSDGIGGYEATNNHCHGVRSRRLGAGAKYLEVLELKRKPDHLAKLAPSRNRYRTRKQPGIHLSARDSDILLSCL